MSKIRVNIKTRVNNATIRREKREGKDIIIVPSATLPDDVIMNRIKYPASEIAKSYKTLDRTFAPYGHPKVNGVYVSANDPQAVANYWVGAWNENVRRENGIVLVDKVIDVENAQSTERGRKLLEAIDNDEPIHTSTGVFLEKTPVDEEDHDFVASDMTFDHDAILLHEEGAATPAQGVGMMVNSDGNSEQIDVINSDLPERVKNDLDMLASMVIDTYARHDTESRFAGVRTKIVDFFTEIFTSDKAEMLANSQSKKEDNDMPVSEEKFDKLVESVNALAKKFEGFGESTKTVVNEAVTPLKDQIDALNKDREAEMKAKKASHIEAVVNAGILEQAEAEATPLNVLEKLAANTKNGKPGPGLSGNEGDPSDDPWKEYDMNAAMEEGK